MKNVVLWELTPCGSFKNRLIGGTNRLHHQGDKDRLVFLGSVLRLIVTDKVPSRSRKLRLTTVGDPPR
jgi:hypothetical protein